MAFHSASPLSLRSVVYVRCAPPRPVRRLQHRQTLLMAILPIPHLTQSVLTTPLPFQSQRDLQQCFSPGPTVIHILARTSLAAATITPANRRRRTYALSMTCPQWPNLLHQKQADLVRLDGTDQWRSSNRQLYMHASRMYSTAIQDPASAQASRNQLAA